MRLQKYRIDGLSTSHDGQVVAQALSMGMLFSGFQNCRDGIQRAEHSSSFPNVRQRSDIHDAGVIVEFLLNLRSWHVTDDIL